MFPSNAPCADPVFSRTYSRLKPDNTREKWQDTCERITEGIAELGKLTDDEKQLLYSNALALKSLPSGRWLWVGGTDWVKVPKNFYGAYNCSSSNLDTLKAFELMMNLTMQGCGTGAVIEPRYIEKLPPILNTISVKVTGEPGSSKIRTERTSVKVVGDRKYLFLVGDSREGWCDSYLSILQLATDNLLVGDGAIEVEIDLSGIRGEGEKLKGFGGIANPTLLPQLYPRIVKILNGAVGRKLNSAECCLLIDEPSLVIVSGNVRRCLPGETLVHTQSGLIPIQKIRIGDRVLTSKGFYPVTNFFDQGVQTLSRIKTEDGYLECTSDHKVAVLSDFYGGYKMVKAKDLKPGDRLVFVPQSIPGIPTELPEFKNQSTQNKKSVTIPALTNKVAYFLGYLHGNGCVSSDGTKVRFSIPEQHPQILERLISVACEFGINSYSLTTPEQRKSKAFELHFNSKSFNEYFSYFKRPFSSMSIPDCILMGVKEIREAYLAGLADADGCHSQGVLVASTHKDFLRQVQALYSSLAITTRLCSSVRKRTNKWEGELVTVGQNAFEATSALLTTHSLHYLSHKKETPKSFKDHGFPIEMVKPMVSSYRYRYGGHQEQVIVTTLKRLVPTTTDLVPVKVKSIEHGVRTAHTFDIEVASIHEFVCEGLLVSNSAGMRQFSDNDPDSYKLKENLWKVDSDGNWTIDPDKDALRMANHTRVFHRKPTRAECIEAVRSQYYSGEGAIQYAPEAIARSNVDLLDTNDKKVEFLGLYSSDPTEAKEYLRSLASSDDDVDYRMNTYGLNPCGEIVLQDNLCNLSEVHLSQIDPFNIEEQKSAFKAASLWACSLLHHEFVDEKLRKSRELDPIVGVGMTGIFDFFVKFFGVDWLHWWEAGRASKWGETKTGVYLSDTFHDVEVRCLKTWRKFVENDVSDYCKRHNLKTPNRCTTVKPSGTQSLLSNSSPGWHPPKGAWYIRRITFARDNPVALACIDYGYTVIPSQSSRDEFGNLLNDPYDPKCTEWLVEIPVAAPWATLEGVTDIDVGKFSALAQFDFMMQIQKHYVGHNTSSTLEFTEAEIEPLGNAIYQAIQSNDGYISAALLARFEAKQTFPRMPFEPISKETYEALSEGVNQRRSVNTFEDALKKYDTADLPNVLVACETDKCLI